MKYVLTLPPEVDLSLLVGDTVQIDVKPNEAGAFCMLSSSATFNPPLPHGYLASGIWPNQQQYPAGATAETSGSVNYKFTAGSLECNDGVKATIGKLIHVNSSVREDKH